MSAALRGTCRTDVVREAVRRPGLMGACLTLAVAFILAACTAAPGGGAGTVSTAPSASAGTPPDRSATPSHAPSAVPSPSPAPSPSLSPLALLGPLPARALDDATAAKLQAVLDSVVHGGGPDAIAAVITPDGTWAGSAGVDGPGDRKATPEDAAAISSVGKMFDAALVMRLVEAGKMDVEAPISDYLQGIEVDANGATVGQALAMRTGIGDTLGGFLGQVYADCAHEWTRDEILASFPSPGSTPGRFEYSNPTYKLVGWAAEQASGMSLAEALRTYVLEPAGVERIVVQGPDATTRPPVALPIDGHNGAISLDEFGRDGTLPCMADATFTLASGSSISADMPSLARWGWELFGGRIVSPASLETMLPPADVDGYGLGIDGWLDFGVPTYGHSGGKPGYKTILAYQPSRQAVVALVVNDGDHDEIRTARRLFSALGGG